MRVRRSVEYLSLVLFAEDYSETNLKMNLCEFHIGFWTRVLVVAVWISNFSVSRGKKDLCYVTIFAQSHILHMTVLSKARSPWFLGEPKTWYFINKRILSGCVTAKNNILHACSKHQGSKEPSSCSNCKRKHMSGAVFFAHTINVKWFSDQKSSSLTVPPTKSLLHFAWHVKMWKLFPSSFFSRPMEMADRASL